MDIVKLRKILQRYRKGQSNETENALVEAWYRSYEVEEQELSDDESRRIRNNISRNIESANKKTTVFYLPVFRVAASIAIVFGVSFFTWRIFFAKPAGADYYTVITNTKGLKQITLPDGSVVWINAMSRLKIPQAFEGHLREVFLEDGEAFFDIKRDMDHPFIVHAAPVNVQVLGTSFNVRAYKSLGKIDISVATGKVGVTCRQKTLAMLLPGQQLSFDAVTGTFEQKNTNSSQAQSWKHGYTYLKQASFKELAIIVRNIYGLSIKAGNKKVNSYRFSMRLMHNLPSAQIIGLITKIHQTHFRKEGNDIILY